MEILIAILAALFGGVIFFKKKADDAAVDAKLARTKGRDKELILTEDELKKQISEIDNNLAKMRKTRAERKKKDDNLSLAERRDKIRKGLKDE